MSDSELKFLQSEAENARLALEVAKKEAAHLRYTTDTLFTAELNQQWVESLAKNEALAEKVDAFASRFARLQDHIGDKLVPRFTALLGEPQRSMVDQMAYAEKLGWIDDAEAFFAARKLRHLLVHEYIGESPVFLEALRECRQATSMLLGVVDAINSEAARLKLLV